MCRMMTFNWGINQKLKTKVIREGEPIKYQDTALWDMQYHSILGWAKDLLKFKYLQELWVFTEKWHHQSTEAKKLGASQENWKNNFVGLHAMTSTQKKIEART